MNFEIGLMNLERAIRRTLVPTNSEIYLDFVGWKRQIIESMEEERRFAGLGPQEQQRRERALRELDRLSLDYAGRSFADLCEIKGESEILPKDFAHRAQIDPSNSKTASRYDVFLSYSHHDQNWVRGWLLLCLDNANLKVCIDFRDFEAGAPSVTEMERAVRDSTKTAIVLTPEYLASGWAEFENIMAQSLDPGSRKRRLLPLLLKQCELPLRISNLTYLDFTAPDQWNFQLERLIAAIRK